MSSTPAAPPHAPSTPPDAGQRFGPTHQLILITVFLALGTGLFTTGTPPAKVFELLGGCGAISAATITAAGGGRRLAAVLIEAAVRAAAGK